MTSGFDLEGYLSERRRPIEAALERAMDALTGASGVDGEVAGAMRHGVLTGGKRLRPLLCVTAWEACRNGAPEADGADAAEGRPRGSGSAPVRAPDAVYDLAAALELIHGYSLVHDDLPCMDDADLRRGRPTTWREHGEDAGMRAGAALIPGAALRAWEACAELELPDETTSAVVRALLEAAGAGGMVGGQWLDLRAEGTLLTEVELDELHRHKTGALLTAALEMGGLAAGAGRTALEALGRYGAAVGLAFQVADDILDATEEVAVLGKNPSDADLDKSTYVSLHGLAEARERAEALADDACRALEEGGVDAPALHALARFVVDRRN